MTTAQQKQKKRYPHKLLPISAKEIESNIYQHQNWEQKKIRGIGSPDH